MINSVFVTGGTGNQGGAAARHLLQHGFRVKVLTRSVDSASAQSLKKLNAEVIQGDLNQPETYRHHVKDIDAIFGVLTYGEGTKKEISQGIRLVDIARENNVKHFIYSSVIGSDLNTGIPIWESKNQIENHIRKSNLPHTILRPTFFFENFLNPEVRKRVLKGKFVSPIHKNVVQQLVSAEDVGRISVPILKNPEKYLSRIIVLASEELNQLQVASTFSEVLGLDIQYQKLPSLIVRLVMGKNLHKMFNWVNAHNAIFVEDMDALKNEFPGMVSLKQWIKQNYKLSGLKS